MTLFNLFSPSWWRARINNQTSHVLARLEILEITMSTAIQAFATKQAAFNTKISQAIDGIKGDIIGLNQKITELQTSDGPLSAEDQDTLDTLQTQAAALLEKISAVDELTPPDVPPAQPPATETGEGDASGNGGEA